MLKKRVFVAIALAAVAAFPQTAAADDDSHCVKVGVGVPGPVEGGGGHYHVCFACIYPPRLPKICAPIGECLIWHYVCL